VRRPALVDAKAVLQAEVVLPPVFLDDELCHLLVDGDAVALCQLQNILEGQFTLSVGVTLVHSAHGLFGKGFSALVGFLAGNEIDESCGGDVRIISGQPANDAVVFSERF